MWFLTKSIADLSCLIAYKVLKCNFFPIFHISVIIENILMVVYISDFLKIQSLFKKVLFTLPVFIFGLEVFFYGSFFDLNKIGLISNNAVVSILLLILLLNQLKIEKREFLLILNLFVFHSISFVYFLFDHIRRYNDYISKNIYPVYIVFVVILNLHFLYFVWSRRKK
ncbi:MAG: hypothetical protein RL264_1532 [Bacteroidota bacterium]|jgi:hypothetical protein